MIRNMTKFAEKAKDLPLHMLQTALSGVGQALLLGDRVRTRVKGLAGQNEDLDESRKTADQLTDSEEKSGEKAEEKPARREPVIFAPRPEKAATMAPSSESNGSKASEPVIFTPAKSTPAATETADARPKPAEAEAPVTEAKAVEAEAPVTEAPASPAAETKAADVETPVTQAPAVEAEAPVIEVKAADVAPVTEAKAVETEAPVSPTAETKATDVEAPIPDSAETTSAEPEVSAPKVVETAAPATPETGDTEATAPEARLKIVEDSAPEAGVEIAAPPARKARASKAKVTKAKVTDAEAAEPGTADAAAVEVTETQAAKPAVDQPLAEAVAVPAEPMAGYSELTVASLRARMRGKTAVQIQELLAYERATSAREAVVRMYENRLAKLEAAE
jgi:hypothetical protein